MVNAFQKLKFVVPSFELIFKATRKSLLIAPAFLFFNIPLATATPDGSLSDTNLQYFGRWDFSDPTQYVSRWGGAYIKVDFSGTTAKIKLGHKSSYYVKIDNNSWVTYSNVAGTVDLTPVSLANGIHSLSVAQGKDYDYVFNFQGLILDAGATTSLPAVGSSLIEFIGDSITTGYRDAQANVADYAWVCSENLNCEHVQIAYPGVNLVSGYTKTGMDTQYFKKDSFAQDSSENWDFARYAPQVVVINLGQNDGGANHVPGDVFQIHCEKFLAGIRTKYPHTEIFVMRPFLGFEGPAALAAVTALKNAGDNRIHYINTINWLDKTDYVDGVHPTTAGNIKAAKLLQPFLAPYVGDVVGKVTVGYQGWFSARNDGSPVNDWGHDNLEMWPDVREYARTYEIHSALGNGRPAKMFSSYDDQVVQTHFKWMAENGIDGAALQRFANEISPGSIVKEQRDGMAIKVMKAAQATGRKFYIMYDVSGWGVRGLKEDWTDTIVATLHLTSSPAYARQNGKPVICIYGMGYVGWPATPDAALDVINWFKAQGCYVIGSVPGQWRSGNGDSRSNFADVYSAFDMLSAWAVGRVMNTAYPLWIKGDRDYCEANNIDYQPCIYPGTSFHNSNGSKANLVPRRHGDFMWAQFATLRSLGIRTVYIAMFDELNEATSIFKCAENTSMMPTNKWFLPLDADGIHVSSDFYLRLVNNGGQMIKEVGPFQKVNTTPFVIPNKIMTASAH